MTKPPTPQRSKKTAPAPNAELPRGCSLVHWTNADGVQEVRYRVRVSRKNLKINKLVATLEEAETLLGVSKKVTQNIFEITKEQQDAVNSLMFDDLQTQLTKYIKDKYKDETEPKKLRQKSSELSRIKTICKTSFFISNTYQSVEFGSFSIYKIKRRNLLEYCEQRDLKTVAQETVRRELSMLQGFFKAKMNASSSVDLFDTSPFFGFSYKFKYAYERKEKTRITEAQENKLLSVLSKNKQMLDITKIALLTGMRKSEILFLRKSQIGDNYIFLQKTDTKTNKKRSVLIGEAVKEILKDYKNERVFSYTIDGFNSNWKRALKSAEIENFTFHNLRYEFISRLLALDLNDIQKQQLAGILSFDYWKKTYIQTQKALETIEEVAQHVGHSRLAQVSSYTVREQK